jgi:hypothetical protein
LSKFFVAPGKNKKKRTEPRRRTGRRKRRLVLPRPGAPGKNGQKVVKKVAKN